MSVIFKLIPGSENYYAGSDGNIYSNFGKKFKVLRKSIQKTGKYYHVSVVINGIRKSQRVHRLVCSSFHDLPENDKMTASHLNGDWRDNRPENLKWETMSENHAKKKEHGTDDIGIKNSRSLIKLSQLTQIRKLLEAGNLTHKEIGEKFGVSRLFITKIKNGHRYKGQG